MNAPLLIELFTEELPPKALRKLGTAFAEGIANSLIKSQLKSAASAMRVFATPRRLAVLIADVVEKAPDRADSKKLMPAKVAYDSNGQPTTALLKRLEKENGSVAELSRQGEGDAQYVYLNQNIAGVSLTVGLQSALEEAITKLPIPKVMSYQLADGATTVRFVRPAHGLVALHGNDVVNVSVLGLDAGRVTHGHRFQGVRDIAIATAIAYEEALAAHGRVIADFDARRKKILDQLIAASTAISASLGPEADYLPLLEEVTALVENPAVYAGQFEAEYLAVPQECLILTMRQNQRYFPLFDTAGKLINRFLIVSNMVIENPSNIVEGNQRVIRPRLADARFFFETDKKTRLADRVAQLKNVIYLKQLGSQFERVERTRALARLIAQRIGADANLADRAALLAKADLVTQMVGEFPELQGIMGRYYALADGEPQSVAASIQSHYQPRFAGDHLPQGGVASAHALADKLETLAGLFGVGQQPTGDKDPFALRRHALGVIRILIENNLDVSLDDLINDAYSVFPNGTLQGTQSNLTQFIHDRLRSYLRDAGYSVTEIEAVLWLAPTRLDQVPRQLAAVRAFAELPEAASLAAANKRIANIRKQAEAKGESYSQVDTAALIDPAEKDLFHALSEAVTRAEPLFEGGDYTAYLKAFAVLKSPVDNFFDKVMVMADDPALRRNRLALLTDLSHAMNRFADIAKLAA